MKEIIREYAMSNAELMLLASRLIANMTRDSTQFTTRGVNSAAITAFTTLANAFEVFPPDEVYVGDIKDETTAKNVLRNTLTVEIQTISGFFEQKWGADTGKYSSLRIKGFHSFSDANFLLTARNVATQANVYVADLTPIGLTTGMITDLNTNATAFETSLTSINTKKELRDSKAQERNTKGNELYGFAVQYSKIGKLIWENVDEAKFNDYIIYHAAPNLPSKVQNLLYDLPTHTLSWQAAGSATGYELEYKSQSPIGPVPDWINIYSGGALSFLHNPGVGAWLYRCRGTNENGSGEWSDELPVLI